MNGTPRGVCARFAILASVVTAIISGGCGTNLTDQSVLRNITLSTCDALPPDVNAPFETVVLDWSGGRNQIYPDIDFAEFDAQQFATGDGKSLADQEARFQEDVRSEVARIFCDLDGINVVVRNGRSSTADGENVVKITQNAKPGGGPNIGEGEYDPCNRQHDNAALIYGQSIRELADALPYDDWVTIFANTCAHEIGHTLGFGHITRAEWISSDARMASAGEGADTSATGATASSRPIPSDVNAMTSAASDAEPRNILGVELMLEGHTLEELLTPQRFIYEQSHCPRPAGGEKSVLTATSDATKGCTCTGH